MGSEATLTIIEGAGKGQSYPLAGKPHHVLGRGQTVDIPVLDIKCSREHAKLERRGDGWYLVDLGGTNGTRVNGQRLAKNSFQRLVPGDKVRLGEVVFGFQAVEERAPVAAPWEVSGMAAAPTEPLPATRPPVRGPAPPLAAAQTPAADPFELAFDFDAAAPPAPAPPPPPDAPAGRLATPIAADREDANALRTFIFDEQPEFDPAREPARPTAEAADADALRTFVFDQQQPAPGGLELELDAPVLDSVSEVSKAIPPRQSTDRPVAARNTTRAPDPVLGGPVPLTDLNDPHDDFDAHGRTLDMAPLKPKKKQPELPPGLKHTVVLDTSSEPPPPIDDPEAAGRTMLLDDPPDFDEPVVADADKEQDLGRTMMFDGQPDFSDLKEEAPGGTILLSGPPNFGGGPGDTTAAPPALAKKKPGGEPPLIDRTLVLDGPPEFGEEPGPPPPPPPPPPPAEPPNMDRTIMLDGPPEFGDLKDEPEQLGHTMILDAPPDFGSTPSPSDDDEGSAPNRTLLLDCPPEFGEEPGPKPTGKKAGKGGPPPAIDRTLILDGPPEFGDETEDEPASRTMMLDGPPEFGDGEDEEEKGDAAGRTILLDGPPEFE